MTKEKRNKRDQNRRAIARQKAMGWKPMFYRLPPEVYSAVLKFKNRAMAEWRQKQESALPLELVNEIVQTEIHD